MVSLHIRRTCTFLMPSCATDRGEKSVGSFSIRDEFPKDNGNKHRLFFRHKRREGPTLFLPNGKSCAGRGVTFCMRGRGPFSCSGERDRKTRGVEREREKRGAGQSRTDQEEKEGRKAAEMLPHINSAPAGRNHSDECHAHAGHAMPCKSLRRWYSRG